MSEEPMYAIWWPEHKCVFVNGSLLDTENPSYMARVSVGRIDLLNDQIPIGSFDDMHTYIVAVSYSLPKFIAGAEPIELSVIKDIINMSKL